MVISAVILQCYLSLISRLIDPIKWRNKIFESQFCGILAHFKCSQVYQTLYQVCRFRTSGTAVRINRCGVSKNSCEIDVDLWSGVQTLEQRSMKIGRNTGGKSR